MSTLFILPGIACIRAIQWIEIKMNFEPLKPGERVSCSFKPLLKKYHPYIREGGEYFLLIDFTNTSDATKGRYRPFIVDERGIEKTMSEIISDWGAEKVFTRYCGTEYTFKLGNYILHQDLRFMTPVPLDVSEWPDLTHYLAIENTGEVDICFNRAVLRFQYEIEV